MYQRLCSVGLALAGLLIALLASLSSSPPAEAQLIGADPDTYLPAPEELPAGFVHWPERDAAPTGPGAAGTLRAYVRVNPEVGPSDVTVLEVGATVSESMTRAEQVFQDTITLWRAHGYTFEPFPGALGEEAVVGRLAINVPNVAPMESVLLYFRLGAVNGVVGWTDYAHLPNLEQAQGVARLIEARARASPTAR